MLRVEVDRESDGRWIAEVPALPGVLAYGATEEEARARTEALALRVIADRLEHGEPVPNEVRAASLRERLAFGEGAPGAQPDSDYDVADGFS
jgi:predicted RNase H-like HicB family nuclease